MTIHALELTGFQAETVLLPDEHGNEVEAIRITVFGPCFPERALVPELWLGGLRAERVSIAPDGHSLRGYLREHPPEEAVVVVRYGQSQLGRIERAFHRRQVRPLPEEC